jgi:AcrR family transcriptional regulator
MARTYNSKRRTESAERTRQAIVDAAVRLHGLGVTAMAEVAKEAGVALPTVTKYFPTREDLFQACTSHFNTTLDIPAPDDLALIKDPGERLREVIRRVYALHETTIGQIWTGYRLEDDSPILKDAVTSYEGFIDAITTVAIGKRKPSAGTIDNKTAHAIVRGVLSPLTYRALRLKGKLETQEAAELVTIMLAGVLDISL